MGRARTDSAALRAKLRVLDSRLGKMEELYHRGREFIQEVRLIALRIQNGRGETSASKFDPMPVARDRAGTKSKQALMAVAGGERK